MIARCNVQTDNDVLLVCIGDTHYGKVTDKYNTYVLKNSIERFRSGLEGYILSNDKDYSVIYIFLGDIVDGQCIFPQQPYNSEPQDPISQIEGCIYLFSDVFACINDIAHVVGFIPVIGNHGRVSKFHPIETSWDRVVYSFLDKEKVFGGNILKLYHAQFVLASINGFNVFVHHGHTIRMRSRTPYPGMEDRILRWQNTLKMFFDIVIIGHFHRSSRLSLAGVDIVMNGTTVRGDDYTFAGGWGEDNRWWVIEIGKKTNYVEISV